MENEFLCKTNIFGSKKLIDNRFDIQKKTIKNANFFEAFKFNQ